MKPVAALALRLSCAALPALAAASAQAAPITDAAGDYVNGYAGSRLGDLDVLSSFVNYDPAADRFLFSGTMNGAIGLSPQGFYVWGVNRGGGTAGFAANGLPNVLFDAVVILNADGTGRVSVGGALPAGTVRVAGSTVSAVVAGSLLPSNGFAKADYTWNLWPRDGTLPAGFGQISDFAPNATNAPVAIAAVVPEPAGAALLAAGLVAAMAARRRRGA